MPTPPELTPEQRAIVETGDGPVVVIAGAGTGKTRVIVERVRWLLETRGDRVATSGAFVPAEPEPRHGNPFDGPLVPEQLLVLTYNVKAAAELQTRLDEAVGAATRARMTVSNFHSFCQHVLTESSADAGLPARPEVLDGVAQLLLLRDMREALDLRYHSDFAWADFVTFINRAKDELVMPDDFEAWVDTERAIYEERYGPYTDVEERLRNTSGVRGIKDVRGQYAALRSWERARDAGTLPPTPPCKKAQKAPRPGAIAHREARRYVAGDGYAHSPKDFDEEQRERIAVLAADYECDGAAFEILRLDELTQVYRAYEEAIAARGALDYGEQIALVTRLFKERPNVLRQWQRRFRYILVDEFQDANVAQIELIELLGRTPDRPDNVMVVGDDDQSIYRFRGASFAAFAEFDARFSRPPAHAPDAPAPGAPRHLAIEQNFRSVRHVLDGANRLIRRNDTRFAPDKVLRTDREPGQPIQLLVCAGPEDEAVAIVDAIRGLVGPAAGAGPAPGAGRVAAASIPVASIPVASAPVGRGHPVDAHVAVVPTMRNDRADNAALVHAAAGGAAAATTAAGDTGASGAPGDATPVATVVPLAWNYPDSGAVGDTATAAPGDTAAPAAPAARAWNDVAILYRKHKHRDAIVDRLRAEDIPYTVVGGLSLFETPEIRDLDQALRAIADPTSDPALIRMMTAGPWRLDALEILAVTRDARFDKSHVIAAVKRMVERGEQQETLAGDERERERAESTARTAPVPAETRARLRTLLAAIEELNPLTWREGPYTILERYVELTGVVLSLLAAGTLEAKRSVVNIASFLRFAADWQGANPSGTLAGFVDYLDAYTGAGGELPTAVELSEDVEGVRLMTLYQAKGLEFPIVIVPDLLEGEWPVTEQGTGWFPRELLREQVPGGNIHTDEERRLLYVAMTRAQERLVLSTHAGPAAKKPQSRFVGELLEEHGAELVVIDRTQATVASADDGAGPGAREGAGETDDDLAEAIDNADGGPEEDEDVEARATATALAAARRVMPLPTARERRLVLRLRAAELVGLMEAASAEDPETAEARTAYEARLVEIGRAAAMRADEARAAGLDPLTFRTVALDTGAGANLLRVVAAPSGFSYTSVSTYQKCPLRFALSYIYRIPGPEEPKAFFSFGNTAHAAFEGFTRLRRERIAAGEEPPTKEDLQRLFAEQWKPQAFGDTTTEAGYKRRAEGLLDNFWTAELEGVGEALCEEQKFELVLVPDDGSAPVRIYGGIDRIDRLPSGGIEVIDYKTGSTTSQKKVEENLQLTIYALACRETLGLGTPEKVTLYFTESAQRMSTTRTDEQLDAARAEILGIVARIRAGEFTATPAYKTCQYCDYRAMCPERA